MGNLCIVYKPMNIWGYFSSNLYKGKFFVSLKPYIFELFFHILKNINNNIKNFIHFIYLFT